MVPTKKREGDERTPASSAMTGTAADLFFWNDWRGDPLLRMCSIGARGLWMEMLCLAAESTKKGYVLLNGKPPTPEELAQACGVPVEVVPPLLQELMKWGVPSITRNGIYYSRRMIKASKKRLASSKGGKKGGATTRDNKKGIFSTQGCAQEATQEGTQLPIPIPVTYTNTSKEENLSLRERAKKKAGNGTRWPADQTVPEEWITDAEAKRREHSFPEIDLSVQAELFANYWAAKSGKDATKTDWHKTWINWSLRAEERHDTAKRTAHDNFILGAFDAADEYVKRKQRAGD
jgi:hypothetical protein